MVMPWKATGLGNKKDRDIFFATRADANKEAMRMASRNVGRRYVVLEVVGTARLPVDLDITVDVV